MNIRLPITRKAITDELWLVAAAVGCGALHRRSVCPGGRRGARIEEIVVTAQRREENLQEVPIAVSSFSGADLTASRISTIENVALKTPNFTLVPQASGNTTYGVAMRGVALTDSVITVGQPGGHLRRRRRRLEDGWRHLRLRRPRACRGPARAAGDPVRPQHAGRCHQPDLDKAVGRLELQRHRRARQLQPDRGPSSASTRAPRISAASARFRRASQAATWIATAGRRTPSTGDDLDSRHRLGGRLSLRWQPERLSHRRLRVRQAAHPGATARSAADRGFHRVPGWLRQHVAPGRVCPELQRARRAGVSTASIAPIRSSISTGTP